MRSKKFTFEETRPYDLMTQNVSIFSCRTLSLPACIIMSVAVVICLSSCDSCKTKPDFQDKTAPAVTWIVTHPSGKKDTIHEIGNAVVSWSEAVNVLAIVADDGGIVEITTYRSISYDCLGDVLQSPSFGPFEQTIPVSLDSHGEALKIFPVAYDVNTFLICPQSLDFQQGTITLKCSGLNFGNLKTEGVLSIHVNRRF